MTQRPRQRRHASLVSWVDGPLAFSDLSRKGLWVLIADDGGGPSTVVVVRAPYARFLL